MNKVCYKLTDQNRCTYGSFNWHGNRWYETNGRGSLCGSGWLHAYSDPVVALMMNPIHANITNPRLFEARGAGKKLDDCGLKCGYTRLRLVKELDVPEITTVQRVAFGILCAMEVHTNPTFTVWAKAWMDGSDRSRESAEAAMEAMEAEAVAAWAAEAVARAAAEAAWAAEASPGAAKWAARAVAEAAKWAAWVAEVQPLDLPALAKKAIDVK